MVDVDLLKINSEETKQTTNVLLEKFNMSYSYSMVIWTLDIKSTSDSCLFLCEG